MSQISYNQSGGGKPRIRINIIITSTLIAGVLFGMWLFYDVVKWLAIGGGVVAIIGGGAYTAVLVAIKYQQLAAVIDQRRRASLVDWHNDYLRIPEHGFVTVDGGTIAPFYASRPPQVVDGTAQVLPEPERSLDFYRATSGTKQAYKFIAEQRRGKSYLAMHVSDYNRNDTNVVIGTKYEPGEWPNCQKRFLTPPDAARGLRYVLRETERRLQPGALRTPIWRVYLDDWINTVIHHPELAAEFLQVAATQMITAGIVPYFLLQGDSNDDWGNKNSARLKNNFTGLWITGPRDEIGDPIPSQNKAEIVYTGGERLPVRLPQSMPQLGQAALPVPISDDERILQAVTPGASYRAICDRAGLSSGGNVNRRIDEVLTAAGWTYDDGWQKTL